MVHDHLVKFDEEFALKGLGEKVCHHFSSRTVLDLEIPIIDPVSDEEISDIQMLGLLELKSLSLFSSKIVLWLS